MIKKNEGYALPFVLVVSVVMCLIAVAVMSFSLKNLQTQQASIQQMQAKYDAAGKIENLLADIVLANSNDPTEEFKHEETDFMVFSVSDDKKEFTVAATDENRAVWVVAVVRAVDEATDFEVTRKTSASDTYGYLSVVGCNELEYLEYLEYKVVDEETVRSEYVTHLKQVESGVQP